MSWYPANETSAVIFQECRQNETSEQIFTENLSTLLLVIRRVYLHVAAQPRLDMMALTTPFPFSDNRRRLEDKPKNIPLAASMEAYNQD